jgi:hypothetical protein
MMDNEIDIDVKDDEWIMVGVSWKREPDTLRVYAYGERIYPPPRNRKRFYRVRRFFKLLLSRRLRQRLERYQLAYGRRVWIGNLTNGSCVIGARNDNPK